MACHSAPALLSIHNRIHTSIPHTGTLKWCQTAQNCRRSSPFPLQSISTITMRTEIEKQIMKKSKHNASTQSCQTTRYRVFTQCIGTWGVHEHIFLQMRRFMSVWKSRRLGWLPVVSRQRKCFAESLISTYPLLRRSRPSLYELRGHSCI